VLTITRHEEMTPQVLCETRRCETRRFEVVRIEQPFGRGLDPAAQPSGTSFERVTCEPCQPAIERTLDQATYSRCHDEADDNDAGHGQDRGRHIQISTEQPGGTSEECNCEAGNLAGPELWIRAVFLFTLRAEVRAGSLCEAAAASGTLEPAPSPRKLPPLFNRLEANPVFVTAKDLRCGIGELMKVKRPGGTDLAGQESIEAPEPSATQPQGIRCTMRVSPVGARPKQLSHISVSAVWGDSLISASLTPRLGERCASS
jgi:hypothetical protein